MWAFWGQAVSHAITPTPRWGCYDEYKKRHDDLWPELSEVMSQKGIDMVIYRHEDLLFVYGTAPRRGPPQSGQRVTSMRETVVLGLSHGTRCQLQADRRRLPLRLPLRSA